MKGHSYTTSLTMMIIRASSSSRVLLVMVVRNGRSHGFVGVVGLLVLLARRAKREGDGSFIHYSFMMMMMRFQEGTTSTITRTR